MFYFNEACCICIYSNLDYAMKQSHKATQIWPSLCQPKMQDAPRMQH